MKIATLRKIFNIFPQSLFLVGSNGTVATPNEVEILQSQLVVTQRPISLLDLPTPCMYIRASNQPSTSKYAKAGSKAAKWKPSLSLSLMRNKPPGVAKQEGQRGKRGKGHGEAWTKTIEICTYDNTYAMRKTLNLPITLSEKTASISRVAEIVSLESFEGEEVVLLDADNLKIPDSAGT